MEIMILGRLLPIFVGRCVSQLRSSLDFGGHQVRLSVGWSWLTSYGLLHLSACFYVIFALAFVSFFHLFSLFILTWFSPWLPLYFDVLYVLTCFALTLWLPFAFWHLAWSVLVVSDVVYWSRILWVGLSSSRCYLHILIPLFRLSLLSVFIYCHWTCQLFSAPWSVISAPPVGSSYLCGVRLP